MQPGSLQRFGLPLSWARCSWRGPWGLGAVIGRYFERTGWCCPLRARATKSSGPVMAARSLAGRHLRIGDLFLRLLSSSTLPAEACQPCIIDTLLPSRRASFERNGEAAPAVFLSTLSTPWACRREADKFLARSSERSSPLSSIPSPVATSGVASLAALLRTS